MQAKKFFISWIFASLVMYILSYVWHGIVLNDFNFLSYPVSVYLSFAAFVYLLAGAIMAKVFTFSFVEKIAKNRLVRGAVSGAVFGIVFYLFALVFGISFSKSLTLEYIVFDLSWQVVEQCIGGFVIGLVHVLVWDDSMIKIEEMD